MLPALRVAEHSLGMTPICAPPWLPGMLDTPDHAFPVHPIMHMSTPALILMFVAPTAGATPSPANVPAEFYGWVIKHSGGGLPSDASLLPGRALLSRELTGLIAAARVTEEKYVASTAPGLTPAIFEGDMFVDSYEGVTHLVSLRLQPAGNRMRVRSRLQHREAGGKWPVFTWSDQLLLIREDGRWVVGDVGGAAGGFTLVATLRKYNKGEC